MLSRITPESGERWAAIFGYYHRALERKLAARRPDPDDLQELLSETWARAYARIETYDHSGSFWGWLLAIADHRLKDQVRQSVREIRHQEAYERHLQNELPTKADEQLILALSVHECLARLSPRERRLVELWSVRTPHAEIAKELGISVGSSMTLLGRILAKLRRELG